MKIMLDRKQLLGFRLVAETELGVTMTGIKASGIKVAGVKSLGVKTIGRQA